MNVIWSHRIFKKVSGIKINCLVGCRYSVEVALAVVAVGLVLVTLVGVESEEFVIEFVGPTQPWN